MEAMLTKEDRKYIGDIFDKKFDEKFDKRFSEMAIMIQNGFEEVYKRLDTKVDKEDFYSLKEEVHDLKGEVFALKYDLGGLENRLIDGPNRRLDRVEDDVRIIKTKLSL